MTSAERVDYLTSLLLLARGDGRLDVAELATLGQLAADIGASPAERDEAERRAMAGRTPSALPGRLSDRVRLIEDLICLTLADGKITSSEREAVVAAARRAGLAQEQLDGITREVRLRSQRPGKSLVQARCPRCGAPPVSGARFCGECGTAFAVEGGLGESSPGDGGVSGPGITVQLPAAALLGRPELQALLSKQPRVLTAQQGEQRTLLVSWEPEELAAAVPFLTLLETIAGREAWYNGGRRPWNELFGFLPCYQRRQTTAQPERYCFWGQDGILNVFGCIKSRMPWSVAADWCRLGRFESPTSFLFDRERIGQELAARLYPFRFCPALDQAYLREAQRQFPERAVVVPEGPWSYQEADADSPGGLEVALPAGPGDPAPRVVRVDGVQPSDPELGLELVRLALLECGRDRTGIA